MRAHLTYDACDGGTIEAVRVGVEYDLNVRNAAGHTVASVRASDDVMTALMDDLYELSESSSDEMLDRIESELEGNRTKLALRLSQILAGA